jgi:hypothetical protein
MTVELIIKSRMMRWAKYVECTGGEEKYIQNFEWET